MKRLIAAAILTAFIIAVYFTGNYYIKSVLDNSYKLLDECNEEYKLNKSGVSSAEKLKDYWSENEGLLSVFAYHGHIDEVERAIGTMAIYSKSDNSELFYEYSGTVKTLLHQLYEDNSLSMHSVL